MENEKSVIFLIKILYYESWTSLLLHNTTVHISQACHSHSYDCHHHFTLFLLMIYSLGDSARYKLVNEKSCVPWISKRVCAFCKLAIILRFFTLLIRVAYFWVIQDSRTEYSVHSPHKQASSFISSRQSLQRNFTYLLLPCTLYQSSRQRNVRLVWLICNLCNWKREWVNIT